MDIADLLAVCVARGASDMHLSAGVEPLLRIDGDLQRCELPSVSAQCVLELIHSMMTASQREAFETTLEADFSYTVPELGRFRVNAFRQQHGPAAVLRRIGATVPSLASLGLEQVLSPLFNVPHGLILITGATGSGKTTTLAALIDHLNSTRQQHILTIEDPIEFVHTSRRCLINQREESTATPTVSPTHCAQRCVKTRT